MFLSTVFMLQIWSLIIFSWILASQASRWALTKTKKVSLLYRCPENKRAVIYGHRGSRWPVIASSRDWKRSEVERDLLTSRTRHQNAPLNNDYCHTTAFNLYEFNISGVQYFHAKLSPILWVLLWNCRFLTMLRILDKAIKSHKIQPS